MKKKKTPGSGEGRQGGCERRIEVIKKMQNKKQLWGSWRGGGEVWVGVRVDMNKN